MAEHLTPEELEQYVIGALEPAAVSAVEGHVAGCEACATALRREARLELGLAEVAALHPTATVVRPGRWRGRLVRCEDPRSLPECTAKARFDGLVSLGPGAAIDVPRYDEQLLQKRGTP
jgi:anti-sigma factor RsiW